MRKIKLEHPINWNLKMKFFVLPNLPTPDVVEEDRWRRALRLNDEVRAVLVYPESERVLIVEGDFDDREWKEIRGKLVDYFGLQNPEELYRFMERDEKLKGLLRTFWGFGRAGLMSMSVFEGLVKAVIQQQISFIVAEKIAARIVERFGDVVEWRKVRFYDFPSQDTILSAGYDKLRECGLSRRKAELIMEIAGTDGLEELRNLGEEEVYEFLTSFKGIGRWTAELVMSMVLGMNVFPAEDLGIRRAVSKLYFDGELQDSAIVREVANNQFGKFSRDILFYLFLYDRKKVF